MQPHRHAFKETPLYVLLLRVLIMLLFPAFVQQESAPEMMTKVLCWWGYDFPLCLGRGLLLISLQVHQELVSGIGHVPDPIDHVRGAALVCVTFETDLVQG